MFSTNKITWLICTRELLVSLCICKLLVYLWNCYFSLHLSYVVCVQINVRENRRGNQKWTIQRHRQHCTNKKQDTDPPNKNWTGPTKSSNQSTLYIWYVILIGCFTSTSTQIVLKKF